MTEARGKGNYYEPWPVDFALLDLLPDDGLIAGVHWKGKQVKDLVESLNAQIEGAEGVEPFDANILQSRLRSMTVAGHVVNHAGSRGLRVWARTPGGAKFLATRDEVLGLVDAEVVDIDQELGDDT